MLLEELHPAMPYPGVSYRPYLESGALQRMGGLLEHAFDMLVTLLARICGDPYDPVFSAPTGVPRRGWQRIARGDLVRGCRAGSRRRRSEALPRGASRDLILKVAGEYGRELEEVQLQRR
jgi:hypothetical protein